MNKLELSLEEDLAIALGQKVELIWNGKGYNAKLENGFVLTFKNLLEIDNYIADIEEKEELEKEMLCKEYLEFLVGQDKPRIIRKRGELMRKVGIDNFKVYCLKKNYKLSITECDKTFLLKVDKI